MTTQIVPEMPRAWEDSEGWQAYYQRLSRESKLKNAWDMGFFNGTRLYDFARAMLDQQMTRIWIAGCGCSGIGQALAHAGLEVHATDVSPAAIEIQNDPEMGKLAAEYAQKFGNGAEFCAGSFTAEVHDFRNEYRREQFHFVINSRAIQGFTIENQRRIAQVHFAALRPRGAAYIHVHNVQGERCDHLESALADVGFYVPAVEANRWHRRVLRETGIPHGFFLGQAMIPMTGEYEDKALWERDMARLRAFRSEFEQRAKAEWEKNKEWREAAGTKFVQMIYSTG